MNLPNHRNSFGDYCDYMRRRKWPNWLESPLGNKMPGYQD